MPDMSRVRNVAMTGQEPSLPVDKPGRSLLIPLLLLALTFAVHSPALISAFVWDDLVFLDMQLRHLESFQDVLMPPANIPEWQTSYYRPVSIGSYILDKMLYGTSSPWGWHLTNLCIHGLVTILVWRIALAAFIASGWNVEARRTGALTAAVAFAVYPLHVEPVNWCLGRTDLLATAFGLSAILVLLGGRGPKATGRLILAVILMLLTLCSKETGISCAALGLLLVLATQFEQASLADSYDEVSSHDRSTKQILPRLDWNALARVSFAYGLAIVLYLVMRIALVDSSEKHAVQSEASNVFANLVGALGFYFHSAVFPFFRTHIPTLSTLDIVLGIVGALLSIVSIVWLWRRSQANDRWVIIGLGGFFLAVAPCLVLVFNPLAVTLVADRYMYLPSVSVCILAGGIVALALQSQQWQGIVRILAVGAFAFMMSQTWLYGQAWKSERALWANAVKRAPSDSRALTSLAATYLDSEDYEKAVELTTRAVQADEEAYRGWTNLSMGYRKLGQLDDAKAAAIRAERLAPTNTQVLLEVGNVYRESGQLSQAVQVYQRILQIDALNFEAQNNLGGILARTNPTLSLPILQGILTRDPGHLEAYINLGNALARLQRFDQALGIYRSGLERDPRHPGLNKNYKVILQMQQQAAQLQR